MAGLSDMELGYVKARAEVSNDTEARRRCGLPTSTFYTWPEERRQQLLEIAQEYKRDAVARALQILEDSVAEAARVKTKGLKSRKEHIAQAAADSVLDRIMGKATQRQEITGAGGGPIETKDVSDLSDAEAGRRFMALAVATGAEALDAGASEEQRLPEDVSE